MIGEITLLLFPKKSLEIAKEKFDKNSRHL